MTPVLPSSLTADCKTVEVEIKRTNDRKEETNDSQEKDIQKLFSSLIKKNLGPVLVEERAPSCAQTETWLANKFARWKDKHPKFARLKAALLQQRTTRIIIDQKGNKNEIQEKIQRIGTLLYLLEKEHVLENKKITVVLPNSDFSSKRKIIGTIAQLANLAFGAILTWILVTQVPTSWMPNDGPWTRENTWFRNLLPPVGMGLMISTTAIFSLPSYLNTCPKKDRLSFMAKFQQDERISFLLQRGREITPVFSETALDRRTCTFRWQ